MSRRKMDESPEERARIGARIKVAATQANLKLMQLAEAAQIQPPERIYAYVRGITLAPNDVLERIAQVTRVHTDFFNPDKDARQTLALTADSPTPEEGETASYEPGTRSQLQERLEHLQELSDAQNRPKRDRTGYITSLSRMIELTQLLKNKPREGWVHWNLGRARMEDDLDVARQDLQKARELFAESGYDLYRLHATQELAFLLSEQGAFDAAQTYLQETVQADDPDLRWRAQLSLGSLCYRRNDYETALQWYMKVAETLAEIPAERRDQNGLSQLKTHLADIVRATGHFSGAIQLWAHCLEAAFHDRDAAGFLESLMEIAQCRLAMGELNEAKQKLELAVMLSGFLFEDSARLSVAQSLLSTVCAKIGDLDEARDQARRAMKIAYRVGRPRPMILASLALGEANLASRQWQAALDDAQEALNEAVRTKRTREMGQAHELRARAYLKQWEERQTQAEAQAATAEPLTFALSEAQEALRIAEEANSPLERIAAHITLSRIYYLRGEPEESARHAERARELSRTGAVSLNLLNPNAEELPALLRSEEIDLPALFADSQIEAPLLSWQADLMEGMLLERREGIEAAYPLLQSSSETLQQILGGLTQQEARVFRARHPESETVFRGLERIALTSQGKSGTAGFIAAS